MYALLYRSSATCPFDADTERHILEAARARNGLWGLASLLLHGPCVQGCAGFAQWIEGEREAVEALFSLVAEDPRHASVAVLARGDGIGGAPLLAGHGMQTAAADPLPETLDAFLARAAALPDRTEPPRPPE